MPDLAPLVSEYLKNLAKAANAPGAAPELSLRPSLDKLLQDTIKLLEREKQFNLVNEGTTAGVKGRPDFILYSHDSPSGYIEAESIDANLKKLAGHAKHQNDHYRQNLDNFLLTNHLDFQLWHEKRLIATATLPDPRTGLAIPTEREIHELTNLLDRFFGSASITLPALKAPKDLAEALARRTRQLNHAIHITLQTDPASYLHTLKKSFEAELLPNLSDDEFADLYAQTVAYGLFAARCAIQNDKVAEEKFDRLHASEFIPASNPFLAELFQQITSKKLTADIRWITDDIARLLQAAPYVSIRPKSQRSTHYEDPVIHFYETFLAAYDPKLREQRGVYYTPEPVVSYIIRSVDEILVSSFGKKDGLADDSVKILDPATGTGTFLAQTILHIYDRFKKQGNEGFFSPEYVTKKLLPRLFGFELMVAPYTIAHLKLHLLLKDLCPGYDAKKRLEVYLTNTLEPPQTHPELAFAEYISKENNAAAAIKAHEDILVIIGNPPYSGHSANASKYTTDRPDLDKKKGDLTPIGQLLHGQPIILENKKEKIVGDNPKQPNYFQCDGKPLGERNPKWLNDDYVKFIRFSQWRIDRTGEGVLGFITNHGFLDNPTFRGMRQALMQSFHEIHILDLHGNHRKQEVDPDTGNKDENVFDIQQGVAIILALKKKDHFDSIPCKVFHKDLFGKRTERESAKRDAAVMGGKYGWLLGNSLASTCFQNVTADCISPSYNWTKLAKGLNKEWIRAPILSNMMPTGSVGFLTARDELNVGYNEVELWARLQDFASLNPEEARLRYNLGKDVRDWRVHWAQEDFNSNEPSAEKITTVSYRPFDFRKVYFTGNSRGLLCYPRNEITRNYLGRNNFGLITARSNKTQTPDHFLCSNFPSEAKCGESSTQSCNFPLYLYPAVSTPQAADPEAYRVPNFSEDFLKKLAAALDTKRFLIEGYSTELSEMLAEGEKPQLPFDKATGQYHGLPKGVSPEDIFHYIYAVLHSQAYRERYKDFLKIDFPRIPLPKGREVFEALIPLGRKLTALHLLDEAGAPELGESRHGFPNGGSNTVHENFGTKKFPGFDDGDVWINTDQLFKDVSPEVWAHTIGGYQPAEKWLKDRRGRTLTTDDLRHYQRILIAIAETQATMPEIDKAIATHGGFPGAFA